MAFKRCGSLDGAQDPIEYFLLTDAEAATLGQTLVLTSGRLTASAVDTTMPQFVALASRVAETTSVTPLPVERLREDVEYATQSMATVASTLVGTKVTLHTGGLLVTATTTNGLFEISATDGATTTSNVKGYFRR